MSLCYRTLWQKKKRRKICVGSVQLRWSDSFYLPHIQQTVCQDVSENKVMEKVIWSRRWAVTGVAAPRGDTDLRRDRRWPSTEAPLPEKNTPLPAWENPRQAKSWERLHKESGHLSKEWAALSGERDVRSDTRQGLPRQGAIEWFPLKKPGLVFQRRR